MPLRAQVKACVDPKLRTYLGCTIRDIERKTLGNGAQQSNFAWLLQVTRRIRSQPKKRSEGDPHKQYVFGAKVSIVSTSKEIRDSGAAQAVHNTRPGWLNRRRGSPVACR